MSADTIRHLGPTGRSTVLGTFRFGWKADEAPLLDRYRERGGRLLDLALVYGDGAAERAVGDWLRRTGARDEVVLLAKGCHPPHCSPAEVEAEIGRTRELLGADLVDCFILHRDDTVFGVDEWGDALVAEVHGGAITTFGVSNWTVGRTLELLAYVRRRGVDRLALSSCQRSLATVVDTIWPGAIAFEPEALEALPREGVTLLAWSSLAGGYFAGADAREENVRRGWDSAVNRGRRDRARQLAGELGVEPSAVALAWLLGEPQMLAAVGPGSVAQLDAVLAGDELRLSEEQRRWLEEG